MRPVDVDIDYDNELKNCNRCKERKSFQHFSRDKTRKDGMTIVCKECQSSYIKSLTRDRTRDYHYKKYYGISLIEYNDMLLAQECKCAVCRQISTKRLNVDHNHTTGEVRALLCNHCNSSLGLMKEDIGLLLSMIEYIRKYNT